MSASGLTFDPSEFPPLLNAGNNSQSRSCRNFNYLDFQSSMSTLAIQNLMSISSEFSIDHELTASAFDTSLKYKSPPQPYHSSQIYDPNSIENSELSKSSCSMQFLPDDFIANIPKNMIYDRFGMIGLLKLLQIGHYDKSFEILAPGLDLPSLGVSMWQIPGQLHKSFLSPSNHYCMGNTHDIDVSVPIEYLIRRLVADRLCEPTLTLLSNEILFWLFHNCCREEVQLVAAKELYQRDWRFHIKERVWLTRKPGAELSADSFSECSTYYCWNSSSAKKLTRDMHILYADLDNAPETFCLSSNTLNARVQIMSSKTPSFATPSHWQPRVSTATSFVYRCKSSSHSSSCSSLFLPDLSSSSFASSVRGFPNTLSSHISASNSVNSFSNILDEPNRTAKLRFGTVGKQLESDARHNEVFCLNSSTYH